MTHTDYFGQSVFESEFVLEYLMAAHEPSLSCGPQSGETWRMVMWRWPEPVFVISAYAKGPAGAMRIVELPNATEKEPVHVLKSRTRRLSAAEWSQIQNAARKDGFWKLPVYDPKAPCEPESERDTICAHQTLVLMEAQVGRYHVVSATSWSFPEKLVDTLRQLAELD